MIRRLLRLIPRRCSLCGQRTRYTARHWWLDHCGDPMPTNGDTR